MSEYKETVTTSQDSGIDNSGANTQQQTKKINTSVSADSKSVVSNIVWYIVGAIEIMLTFRFVLKIFGANSSSSFVSFVYDVTRVLTAPFDSIFGVSKTTSGNTHSVFEPSIIVAGIVYSLIGWGIVKLLDVNRTQ